MKGFVIVTIDGPAGTGKTTIARKLAERLHFSYFDTGAMYRAVTYGVTKNRIALDNREELTAFLKSFQFSIRERRYFVAEEDVTEIIRSQEITQKVSEVSALGEVREAMMGLQREFAKKAHAVFEGRDMGTVVFPQAEKKIFLTARPAVRAERRYLELKASDKPADQETVFDELMVRDHIDSNRELAPLKPASDAHIVDTSDLSIDEVVDQILAIVKK